MKVLHEPVAVKEEFFFIVESDSVSVNTRKSLEGIYSGKTKKDEDT